MLIESVGMASKGVVGGWCNCGTEHDDLTVGNSAVKYGVLKNFEKKKNFNTYLSSKKVGVRLHVLDTDKQFSTRFETHKRIVFVAREYR